MKEVDLSREENVEGHVIFLAIYHLEDIVLFDWFVLGTDLWQHSTK